MTITLQAVNELIQSLESAGELSINETKVMALAKAFQQLAAENVELKQYALDCVNAVENWNSWADKEDQIHNDMETPATDRIVAGIKADGVDSGIQTIITMLNHQAPGVIDAINVLSVHSFELREGAK